MIKKIAKEGLPLARFVMVLGSLSPLFVLWALRGIPVVSDKILIPCCIALVALPNAFLLWRINVTRKNNDSKTLVVTNPTDHREHLLVYLFAMLIPLYDVNLNGMREVIAAFFAFLFVVFVFWHMNLHYMNIFFAMFGYQVFTIRPISGASKGSETTIVLITHRQHLYEGQNISSVRISNSVYFEPRSQR